MVISTATLSSQGTTRARLIFELSPDAPNETRHLKIEASNSSQLHGFQFSALTLPAAGDDAPRYLGGKRFVFCGEKSGLAECLTAGTRCYSEFGKSPCCPNRLAAQPQRGLRDCDQSCRLRSGRPSRIWNQEETKDRSCLGHSTATNLLSVKSETFLADIKSDQHRVSPALPLCIGARSGGIAKEAPASTQNVQARIAFREYHLLQLDSFHVYLWKVVLFQLQEAFSLPESPKRLNKFGLVSRVWGKRSEANRERRFRWCESGSPSPELRDRPNTPPRRHCDATPISSIGRKVATTTALKSTCLFVISGRPGPVSRMLSLSQVVGATGPHCLVSTPAKYSQLGYTLEMRPNLVVRNKLCVNSKGTSRTIVCSRSLLFNFDAGILVNCPPAAHSKPSPNIGKII